MLILYILIISYSVSHPVTNKTRFTRFRSGPMEQTKENNCPSNSSSQGPIKMWVVCVVTLVMLVLSDHNLCMCVTNVTISICPSPFFLTRQNRTAEVNITCRRPDATETNVLLHIYRIDETRQELLASNTEGQSNLTEANFERQLRTVGNSSAELILRFSQASFDDLKYR